jgi:hypothetical protein
MQKSSLRSLCMSQKKQSSTRLQLTLNELDTAIGQWDSLTNKPQREQVSAENHLQKKAKTLLKELRDQLIEFEKSPDKSQKKL